MAAKKRASKPKKSKPNVGELIVKTVAASKERNGMTLPTLKKALVNTGFNAEKKEASVKVAVKHLVDKGTLDQVKGNSASKSFKMSNVDQKPKKDIKKVPLKAKKPAAKKRKVAKKPKKAETKQAAPAPKKAPPKRRRKAKRRKWTTKKARKTKTAQTVSTRDVKTQSQESSTRKKRKR